LTEHWFYHLEKSSMEAVLPGLLEKTLAKGWRALVKVPQERLAELDGYLWTYTDQSFLPHGRDDEPLSDAQPIRLTSAANSAENAEAVFLLEGAHIDDLTGVQRCITLINGRSDAAVAHARTQWKTLKDEGTDISYWKQNERGAWAKAG